MTLDKRAFMIGLFVSVIAEKQNKVTTATVNTLCKTAGMTQLTQKEAKELERFMNFAGDIMERNGKKLGILEQEWTSR